MNFQTTTATLSATEVADSMTRNVETGVTWGIQATTYAIALLAAVGLLSVMVARFRQ